MMRLKLFFVSVILMCFMNSYAGIETISSRLPLNSYSNPLTTGMVVSVYDPLFTVSSLSDFKDKIIMNTVRVGIDMYSTTVSTAYERNYMLQITGIDPVTSLVINKDVMLNVKYDPYSITHYDLDQSAYHFPGRYNISAEIKGIYDEDGTVVSSPANVYLEVSIEAERYYYFATGDSVSSLLSKPVNLNADDYKEELMISWAPYKGATEYELEWTHVNNYDFSGNTLSSRIPDYNFRNNSTRITTKNNFYNISLIYDRGYLVYRVRPVGIDTVSKSAKLYGVWSTANAGSATSTSNRYETESYLKKLNWQYNAVFAEDGKKKENINYADGSLRSRQTVTKSNTDKLAIVSETLYDYQGRPAVQVLPAPLDSSMIKYYKYFNRDSLSSGVYSKELFDKDVPLLPCVLQNSWMGKGSGASKYYSSNNAWISALLPGKAYEKYLPDANGYPFIRTEYTPDNTGRIRKQGGLGYDLRMGGNRETKYLYGQPHQEELDRLFGSEAGYASRYKKNAVIDPNGQVSISYIDDAERVVATALSGNEMLNLSNLRSYSGSAHTLNTDLFGYDEKSRREKNGFNTDSTMLEFSQPLLVTTAGMYNFSYVINNLPKYTECLRSGICFDCIYDLEIRITNECGINVFTGVEPTRIIGNTSPTDTNLSCVGPISFEVLNNIDVDLPVGAYMITKKLNLNKKVMDYYSNKYVDSVNNSCAMTLNDFINSAVSVIDYSGCNIPINCLACDTLFGPEPVGDSLIALWNYAISNCKKECEPGSLCEANYKAMISDISPNGQYAEYEIDTITHKVSTTAYPLSILNRFNQLPHRLSNYSGSDTVNAAHWRKPSRKVNGFDFQRYFEEDMQYSIIPVAVYEGGLGTEYYPEIIDGTLKFHAETGDPYIYPEELKRIEDFLRYWKPSWAHSLVKHHPEYPYYELCSQNGESDAFDYNMLMTQSYSDALSKDLIAADTVDIDNHMIAEDPYFSGLGSSQISKMMRKLNVYSVKAKLTMYQVAAQAARCPASYGNVLITGCDDFGGSGDTSLNNLEWQNFRSMYLAEKGLLQKAYFDEQTYDQQGYNGCIGNKIYNVLGVITGVNPSVFASDVFQPCGASTFSLYNEKIKRFRGKDDIIPMNTDPFGDPASAAAELKEKLDYAHYQKTAQCPVARDLEYLFTSLFTKGTYDDEFELMTISEFTKELYDAVRAPDTSSAFTAFTWKGEFISSSVFHGMFKNSSLVTVHDMELTLPSPWTWFTLDVIQFGTLQYTGENGFRLPVLIRNGSVQDTIIILGETSLSISGCTFPDHCDPSRLLSDFVELMSTRASANKLMTNESLGDTKLDDAYPGLSEVLDSVANFFWYWNFTPGWEPSFSLESHSGMRLMFKPGDISDYSSIVRFSSPAPIFDDPYYNMKMTGYNASNVPKTYYGSLYFINTINSSLDSLKNELGSCHPPSTFGSSSSPYFCDAGVVFEPMRDLFNLISDSMFVKTYNENGVFNGATIINSFPKSNRPKEITRHLEKYLYDNITITPSYGVNDITFSILGQGVSATGYYPDLENISCQFNLTKVESSAVVFSDYKMIGIGKPFPIYSGGVYKPAVTVYLICTTLCTNKPPLSVDMYISNTCGIPMDICDACNEAPNLVKNGDFEMGIFSVNSDRTYHQQSDLGAQDWPKFALVKNISYFSGDSWESNYNQWNISQNTEDHTNPGKGHFMLSTTSGGYQFMTGLPFITKDWYSSVKVKPRTNYTFSFWHLNLYDHSEPVSVYGRPYADEMYMEINGQTSARSYVNNTLFVPYNQWVQSSMDWYSGEDTIANLSLWGVDNADHFVYAIDDIEFKRSGCSPVDSLGFAFVSPEDPHDTLTCQQSLVNIAVANARHEYQVYVKELEGQFRKNYAAKCLNVDEQFNLEFEDREYHHTLYYYDQAGNLVRTVPPAGVKMVHNTDSLAAIALGRSTGKPTIFMEHDYITGYKYNSLNQLVSQSMPDHTMVNKWTILQSTGVPAGAEITGTQFTDPYNGYMTANYGGIGYIYNTYDGGATWVQQSSIGSTEIQSVKMLGSTKGFAVGSGGALLKTLDGGASWSAVPLGSTAYFTTISFSGSLNGCIGGKNGLLLYTNNGGNTWHNGGAGLVGDVTSIDMKPGAGSFATTVYNGQGHLFRSANGGKSWTEKTQFTVNGLNAINYFDGGKGYIGGDFGTLLYTPDNGTTFTLVSTSFNHNIREIHFKDIDNGCLLLYNGEIWATNNRGADWVLTNAGGVINAMHFSSALNGYAVGNNGRVVRTNNGGVSWTAMTNFPTISGHLLSVDTKGPDVLYVGGVNKILYQSSSVVSTTINWTAITSPNLTEDYVKLNFSGGLKGLVLASNGKAYHLNKTLSWAWTQVSSGVSNFTFSSPDTGYVLFADTIDLIGVTNNVGQTITIRENLPIDGRYFHAIAVNKTNNTKQLTIVGASGRIYSSYNEGLTWINRSTAVIPAPLNAVKVISNSVIYAAGDHGTFLRTTNSGNSWNIVRMPNKAAINALNFKTANDGVAAGNNGAIFTTTDGGIAWTSRTSGTSWAINGLSNSGDTVWAVTDDVQMLRSTNYGSSWSVYNNILDPATAMNSVAAISSTNIIAAGAHGKILRSTDRGVNWTNVTVNANDDILNCTFMVNSEIGYAGGENGLLMRTKDGGRNWEIISPTSLNIKKMFFLDPRVGYLLAGSIYKTVDSGFTWVNLNSPHSSLDDLFFSSETRGYVVKSNGNLYSTSNGGASWTLRNTSTSDNLLAVHFIEETGYISTVNGAILKSEDYGVSWTDQPNPAYNSAALHDLHFIDKRTGYAVGEKGYVLKTIDGGQVWIKKEVDDNRDYKNLTFYGEQNLVLSGPSPVTMNVSDESDRYSSRFWYDRLGRLIISQNSKQVDNSPEKYSYTIYDELGRIIEVGESSNPNDPDNYYVNGVITEGLYRQWLNLSGARNEITRMHYDAPVYNLDLPGFTQSNLRGRVATTTYQDADGSAYNYATHYSYDIHGNVNALVQDDPSMAIVKQQFKLINYEYDLISGNVKQVKYQQGKPDQFIHRYHYDADNRITSVMSSSDGYTWEKDAKYFYYKHGPLARTEVGKYQVQGVDYAYTLQGWLKGVNSNTLRKNRDMGSDANFMSDNANAKIGHDMFGYSLNYFTGIDGDYQKISNTGNDFLASTSSSSFEANSKDLYNGNIKSMVTSVRGLGDDVNGGQGMVYSYDRLNRLVKSAAYKNMNVNTNEWGSSGSVNNYMETYAYDANGNIDTLKRRNASGTMMDNLVYHYERKASGQAVNSNRLLYVDDAAGVVNTVDLGDQSPGNYTYDRIGNLTSDAGENITSIVWNVYGKIKEVNSSSRPDIAYRYDAAGNRIAKILKPSSSPSTWEITSYVRDASGNVMAVYEYSGNDVVLKEQNIYGSSRLGTYRAEQTVFPEPCMSLDFNGSTQKVVVSGGAPAPVSSLTVEAWIHPDNLNSHVSAIGQGIARNTSNGSLGDWMLTVDGSGALRFFNWQTATNDPNGQTVSVPDVIRAGYWQHVAAVYDGSNYKLYVNGVEVTVDQTAATGSGYGTAYEIGHQPQGYFNGRIAELREWRTNRTSAEIFEYMDERLTGEETNLKSYFRLNEGTGNMVYDKTSNTGNGVLDHQAWLSNDCYVSTQHYAGKKAYEFSNHLGNVLTTLSDRKYFASLPDTVAVPIALSSQDYYNFGMLMPDRNENSGDYRFGFNGKENDNEVKGTGNQLDFGARIYDPRLGRWLSVDKFGTLYPGWTPYRFAFNNPIYWVDKDGNIEWPLKGTYSIQKNQSVFLKDQPVYANKSNSWIKQTGMFESSATTPEYRQWENGGKDQNAIIITSAQDMLRKSTTSQPMTSPHIGADFRASVGTDVYSLGDGKVVGIDKKSGNLTVEYGNGDKVTFRHLNGVTSGLEVGSDVFEGQIIAESGMKKTTKPHLHVEAVDNDGKRTSVLGKNYGTVTNEEFFGKFGGDWKKLKEYKDQPETGSDPGPSKADDLHKP